MRGEAYVLEVADRHPENLLLVSTKTLVDFVNDVANDGIQRMKVAAELVARWCLSGSADLSRELRAIFPRWTSFCRWYEVIAVWRDGRHISSETHTGDPEGLVGCESEVRQRLRRLFAVDGFIPVYVASQAEEDALFVPFELEESPLSGIVWSDGTDMAEWHDAARRTLPDGVRCRLQLAPSAGLRFKGESLMLPLRLAVWRRSSEGDFPWYDPLRVVATGALDADGRLVEVATAEKFKAFLKTFRPRGYFIAPDTRGQIDAEERSFLRLDCGADAGEQCATVRSALERTDVTQITWKYAASRLSAMREDVDRLNRANWSDVADLLSRMKEEVCGYREDEHLDFMMLHATALCHAGRTEESLLANREALEVAERRGCEAKAIRLQIDAMVSSQDLGMLEDCRDLAEAVTSRLKTYEGAERDDLSMRYHGTMFQLEAWGSVLGLSGFSSDAARRHIEQAISFAKRIAGQMSVPEDEAESNVAQDLNYRHLWYALFDAGTKAERQARDEARRKAFTLTEAAGRNNLMFLARQMSLAALNAWRGSGVVPTPEELADLTMDETGAENWLVAANRRHIGALAAARGERALAKRCFAEGDRALPSCTGRDTVIASIRFALLTQAACSLAQMGEKADAGEYARKARELLACHRESALFSLMDLPRWEQALSGDVPPDRLPDFYY